MPGEDTSTNPLFNFTREELVDELRRRSSVFLCIGRPHSADGEGYHWFGSWDSPDGRIDQVLGLYEVWKFDILHKSSHEE